MITFAYENNTQDYVTEAAYKLHCYIKSKHQLFILKIG